MRLISATTNFINSIIDAGEHIRREAAKLSSPKPTQLVGALGWASVSGAPAHPGMVLVRAEDSGRLNDKTGKEEQALTATVGEVLAYTRQ